MITMPQQIAPVHAPLNPDSLVCVVDRDEAVRRGLEQLFRSAHLPVETFPSAGDYLERKAHAGAVCLVLDVPPRDKDALNLQGVLAGRSEQIVFLTNHGDVPMCAKAMKAGAVDFLTKPTEDDTLLSAVAIALERSREICRTKTERATARAILGSLTPREHEVTQRVVAGLLNKQIAAELGIAEKTVKIHRGRAMSKTRCLSVPDLLRLVLTAGAAQKPILLMSHS